MAPALPWAEVPAWPVDLVEATARPELGAAGDACAPGSACRRGGVAIVAVLAFDADNTPRRRPQHAVLRRVPVAHRAAVRRPICSNASSGSSTAHPTGHPWLKPVRATAGTFPRRASSSGSTARGARGGGRPVHAGIIEPGTSVSSATARRCCTSRSRSGTSIAASRRPAGGPHRATLAQMETIAGDTTIAHATAHACVREALAGTEAALRAQWLRALALELERLANHTGDLGALANDVAFLPTASACGKIPRRLPQPHRARLRQPLRPRLVRPGGCRARFRTARRETPRRERSRRRCAEASRPRPGSGTRPRCGPL
jgi:hypothetical protein